MLGLIDWFKKTKLTSPFSHCTFGFVCSVDVSTSGSCLTDEKLHYSMINVTETIQYVINTGLLW